MWYNEGYSSQTPMLLVDCCGYTTMRLVESTNGEIKFQGKFQEANAINKNKRMYPYEVLAHNVDQLIETVNERGLYGELDHASDSIVHLTNASHIITKLWWEGNSLMGQGEILPTPNGLILRKLIERGCRIGISSRGVGNGETNNEGVLEIGPSYRLITFDCVANPSTSHAFQKIVNNKEHFEPIKVTKPKPVIESAINSVNHRMLVSFFGAKLNNRLDEIKQNIRNK